MFFSFRNKKQDPKPQATKETADKAVSAKSQSGAKGRTRPLPTSLTGEPTRRAAATPTTRHPSVSMPLSRLVSSTAGAARPVVQPSTAEQFSERAAQEAAPAQNQGVDAELVQRLDCIDAVGFDLIGHCQ